MSADNTLGEKPQRRRPLLGKARAAAEEVQEEARVVSGKAKATPSRRDDDEDEKPKGIAGFFSGIRGYFEGVQSELKKVIWPTREETLRLTWVVLVMLVLSAIVLGLIVLAFTRLFSFGLSQPVILIAFMAIAAVLAIPISRFFSRSQS